MTILSLALLALVLGYIHNLVQPKLAAAVPASIPDNAITKPMLTGAFILVSFFLAQFVLGLVGIRRT